MFNRSAARLAAAAVLAVALIASTIAFGAGKAGYPQVALTDAIVKQFIASYPAVRATADKIAKKYNVERDTSDQTGGWGAWMAATSAWSEMDAAVRPYGFKSFKVWLDDTINIAMAYAFASHGAEMDAGMAQAAEQIKNNPSLSDAQKQMMLQQMQASMGSVNATRPPQGNIEAVKPYANQLASFFGNN
jgi:hypothetical protein